MSAGVKGRVWDSKRANFDRNLSVVIGIDRYRNNSIRNLSTAVSDARAIADLLEQNYDYKRSKKQPDIIRLFDEEATLEALQQLFHTKIPEELQPGEGDRLIIYFAGHGLPRSNDEGPEGYLVPHDADPTEPASFLAMRDISKALDKLECHHLLMILDCCFAGTFRWAGSRKAVPILKTIHREHYYHFIRHPAWQVITSSAHDQEALDVARLKEDNRQPVAGSSDLLFTKEPHSPFALALLEGLHPGDGSQRVKADLFPDGVVTAHELFVYLQTRVKQLSSNQQAPGIYPLRRDYDKGEFVFTPPKFKPEDLAKALPLNEENNPYRGLKSFDEKHADFFFGRQVLIEELVKKLAQPDQALTVVLGVSGSGKSSLVKAGLIPYLRNQNTEQDKELWCILEPMRPGESPFTSLARTLLPIVDESLLERLADVSFLDKIFQPMLQPDAESDKTSVDATLKKVADSWVSAMPEAKLLLIEDYYTQLELLGNSQQRAQFKSLYDQILGKLGSINQQLQDAPQYFSQVITTWHQNYPNRQLLLVIDQFEELLTRSQDDRESSKQTELLSNHPIDQKEWQKFLDALRIAIANHPQTLRLVLTLRSDFEPRFLSSVLESYWKDARFPVRAMNSDELRQAIENPALKQAIYFEDLKDSKGNLIGNLVSKLVDEVGQMPGALPLLSFTLSELYVSLYKRWQEDQSTDRTLRFGDYEILGGVAGALTRRATEEYEALDEKHQATMQRVMLRMVTIEGGGVVRRRVPESELLYSADEENERVPQVINRLVKARLLVKGQETGEPYMEPSHDYLVRGWDKLQQWIKEEQGNLDLQRRLTPAAIDWNKNNRDNEYLWIRDPRLELLGKILEDKINNWLNRLEEEFIEISKQKRYEELEETKKQLETSERRRKLAQMRQLAAQAQLMIRTEGSELTERGLLLAVEAMRQSTKMRIPFFEVDQALRQGLAIAARRLTVLKAPRSISSQAVSLHPLQPIIAFGQEDGEVYLWRLDTGQMEFIHKLGSSIHNVVFSPNGQWFVAGDKAGNCLLMSMENQSIRNLEQLGERLPTCSIVFSSNSNYLAVAFHNKIMVWDVNNHSEAVRFDHPETQPVSSMTFSADSTVLVTQAVTESALCWNWKSQEVVGRFKPSLIGAGQVSQSPDGRLLGFAGSLGFDVTLWDIYTREEIPLAKNGAKLAFSADGRFVGIASPEHFARIWRLPELIVVNTLRHDAEVWDLDFSVDGSLLVTVGRNNVARVWNTETGSEIARMVHSESLISARFLGNSRYVLTHSGDSTLALWDVKELCEARCLNFQVAVLGVAFTDNGYLATSVRRGQGDLVPLLLDFEKQQQVSTLKLADGSETEPSEYAQKLLDQHQQLSKGEVESPNKELIATSNGVQVKVYRRDKVDPESETNRGKLICTLMHGHKVECLVFSPDSRYLVTASESDTGRIWDVESGQEVSRLIHENQSVVDVDFSPDGRLIATASWDRTVRLWFWKPEDLMREASTRLTRNLSPEELGIFLSDVP